MIVVPKYEVAVIIINYNASEYSKKCIESVIALTSSTLNYQIIVIDNASDASDYFNLKEYCTTLNFSELQLIRNNINVGFGTGNMLGVHYSNANYLAFVNNDSFFLNDCLSLLHQFMLDHKEVGVCGPQAFKEDGALLPTIDHFASPTREILGRKFLELINPSNYPKRKKVYSSPQKAQFVAGSFMFVESEAFNQVGGFDTNLFLYYEETDLCKRLAQIKKEAYLVPNAKFVHYHGVSTPRNIDIKIELKISLLYVIRKHYGSIAYCFLLLYLQIQYFVKSIFKPNYWKLFIVLLQGAPLPKSLKTKQIIKEIKD